MAFHPPSVKEQETLNCAYQLHDHTLATVDKVKHLHRVSFQKETIWEVHSNKTCSKANKTLRSLRCNFKISATSTEKTAYKAFARPNLEYATPAWGLQPPPPPPTHTHRRTDNIAGIQRRVAGFVLNRFQTISRVHLTLEQTKYLST